MLEARKAWSEAVGARLRLTDVKNPCALAAPGVSHHGAHAGAFAGSWVLSGIATRRLSRFLTAWRPTAEETFSLEKKLDVQSVSIRQTGFTRTYTESLSAA